MEAVECGAACLAVVLAHHGRIVPLTELRRACGVSRDRSKASNVVKAARAYGLVARGFKKEPLEVAALPMPAVAFWEFNHFVVIEGFVGDRVHLNDPASGPRTVTLAEFDRSFTGVVLTFEPGEEFEPGGEPPSLTSGLVRRLHGYSGAVAFAILAGLALILPGVLLPTFTRVFVDDVLVGGITDWLFPLLTAMSTTLFFLLALCSVCRCLRPRCGR